MQLFNFTYGRTAAVEIPAFIQYVHNNFAALEQNGQLTNLAKGANGETPRVVSIGLEDTASATEIQLRVHYENADFSPAGAYGPSDGFIAFLKVPAEYASAEAYIKDIESKAKAASASQPPRPR